MLWIFYVRAEENVPFQSHLSIKWVFQQAGFALTTLTVSWEDSPGTGDRFIYKNGQNQAEMSQLWAHCMCKALFI